METVDEDQERRHAQAEQLRRGYRRTSRRRVVFGFVAFLLVVAGVGSFTVYQLNKQTGAEAPAHATSDYGFTLKAKDVGGTKKATDPVVVQLYDDYFCDECARFNKAVSAYLRAAVERGDIEVTYHPFVVGNDSSTNNFSERAANAAACVGDEAGAKGYASFHDVVLKHQPKSGKAGAGTARLIAWARDAGADDVAGCIRDKEFLPWIEEAVIEGRRTEVTESPTILVAGTAIVSPGKNGGEVMPDKKELKFAIDEAGKK